jgi:hypothetical protein
MTESHGDKLHPQTDPRWQRARRAVAGMVDRLGRRIDVQIAPAVVALRANGFATNASCQGHMNGGEPTPWIDVGVMASEPQRNAKLDGRYRRANLKEQRRMLNLLDNFYTEREAPSDVRLVLFPFGLAGGFRLTNQGADVQTALPASQRRAKLRIFRREFREFTTFLKTQRSPAQPQMANRNQSLLHHQTTP